MALKTNLIAEIKTSGNAVKIKFSGKVGRVEVYGETQAFYPSFGGSYPHLAQEITRVCRVDGHRYKNPVPDATRYAVIDWVQVQIDECYQTTERETEKP